MLSTIYACLEKASCRLGSGNSSRRSVVTPTRNIIVTKKTPPRIIQDAELQELIELCMH